MNFKSLSLMLLAVVALAGCKAPETTAPEPMVAPPAEQATEAPAEQAAPAEAPAEQTAAPAEQATEAPAADAAHTEDHGAAAH